MRTTLTLEVNDELSEFLNNQAGTTDPSALINKLLRDEMSRQGTTDRQLQFNDQDGLQAEMENFLDENTHAAG